MDDQRLITRHRFHPPDTSTSSTSPPSRKVFLHPKQLRLLKALDRWKAKNLGRSIVSVKLSNPQPPPDLRHLGLSLPTPDLAPTPPRRAE
jgi:hypothetical protein